MALKIIKILCREIRNLLINHFTKHHLKIQSKMLRLDVTTIFCNDFAKSVPKNYFKQRIKILNFMLVLDINLIFNSKVLQHPKTIERKIEQKLLTLH